MKVRKKPIILSAVRWEPDPSFKTRWNTDRGALETHGAPGYDRHNVTYTLLDVGIETKEGFLRIKPGDVIMTGTRGERWAIDKDIFEETYEVIEE